MVGQLCQEEIEAVLGRLHVGRIGYSLDNTPSIVPVTYAYDRSHVYVVSGPGQKIDSMRARPTVCFQVDEFAGSGIWRSVIASGIYEELTSESDRCAALIRINRVLAGRFSCAHEGSDSVIVFRIRLLETTGRFGREL
jgi:nitroimidazol reductase NimA-like FMN-containing flavoprotein (pyridoxamine 5'-phosphate oxidase superfamily)